MSRRILDRWESLADRDRILVGIPLAWVVLFAFHQMFPLLSQPERALYATMEAVPVALVLAWATKNELRRRAERQAAIAKWEAEHPGETWDA
jgi:hypothetical protein